MDRERTLVVFGLSFHWAAEAELVPGGETKRGRIAPSADGTHPLQFAGTFSRPGLTRGRVGPTRGLSFLAWKPSSPAVRRRFSKSSVPSSPSSIRTSLAARERHCLSPARRSPGTGSSRSQPHPTRRRPRLPPSSLRRGAGSAQGLPWACGCSPSLHSSPSWWDWRSSVTSSTLVSRPSVGNQRLRLINPGRPVPARLGINSRRNRLPRNPLPPKRPRPAPWLVLHTAPPLALVPMERDRGSVPPRRVRVRLVPSRGSPGRSGHCRARWHARSDGLRSERATASTATSAGPAGG